MSSDEPKACVICKNQHENTKFSQLTIKGSESVNRASIERTDDIRSTPDNFVHQTCRKIYCHPTNIAQARKKVNNGNNNSKKRQSRHLVRKAEECFRLKTDCFFCGTSVQSGKQRKSLEAFSVTTIEFKESVGR